MIRKLYEENDYTDSMKVEWLDTVPFDELFDEIRDITGLSDLDFTINLKNVRRDLYVMIKSQNLVNKVGFLRLMLKTIIIDGGLSVDVVRDSDIDNPKFRINGHINFSYTHPNYGSNGYDFLWCSYDDVNGWTVRERT